MSMRGGYEGMRELKPTPNNVTGSKLRRIWGPVIMSLKSVYPMNSVSLEAIPNI